MNNTRLDDMILQYAPPTILIGVGVAAAFVPNVPESFRYGVSTVCLGLAAVDQVVFHYRNKHKKQVTNYGSLQRI